MEATTTSGITSNQEVHDAMEKCGGDRSKAADLLGISRTDLNNKIGNNPTLRQRWRYPDTRPSKITSIGREMLPIDPKLADQDVLKSDEQVAAILSLEDQKVRTGLKRMGLSPKEQDMGIALKNFQGKHFGSALQLIGGGITKQFLRCMVEIDKIDERLERAGKDSDFPLPLAEEMMLRDDRSRLLIVMSQFSDRANRSALIQAKIWQIRKNGTIKENDKPTKGFLDLQSSDMKSAGSQS